MISYSRQNQDEPATAAPDAGPEEHIAPAPRVSVQAFCETVETAAAVQAAGEDRRLAKAHLKIQMGGVVAAIEAYRSAPTPNVIVLETDARSDVLAGLDQLATVCDPGTRVIVIGKVNDVTLYRELVRRGVSDYAIAPVQPIDVVRSICNLFSAPEAKAVGRIIAVVGAKEALAHPRSPTTWPGPSLVTWRWTRWWPILISRSAPRGSTTIRTRRRASPRRCLPRPRRYRLRRSAAVEMHRPPQPAGCAGDTGPRLRLWRRCIRLGLRHAPHHDAVHCARRAASMDRVGETVPHHRR